MVKWMKGFITGIFSISFMISLGLMIFYKALIGDMRNKPIRRYPNYSYYRKERGEEE